MEPLIPNPGESTIPGVSQLPLKVLEDDRGAVLHMLRADSPTFTQFGEIYFSIVNPGVAKAWKRHQRMTQRYAVPVGQIRLVLFDDRRSDGSTPILEEHRLGRPDQYRLFIIPPMVWYGFQGISTTPAMIANCTDLAHDPTESERLDLEDPRFGYRWPVFPATGRP